jgi:ABC-2 type transport system permease protein
MIADIFTVAWKELREMLTFGDSRGRNKLSLLVILAIFGVVIPLQSGRDWVTSPVSAMVWAWMPYMWVYSVVADSFAGERERHTLEALLATRLSDRAILFGKLLAALAYGFTLTWAILRGSRRRVTLVFTFDDDWCTGFQYLDFGASSQHWCAGFVTGQ